MRSGLEGLSRKAAPVLAGALLLTGCQLNGEYEDHKSIAPAARKVDAKQALWGAEINRASADLHRQLAGVVAAALENDSPHSGFNRADGGVGIINDHGGEDSTLFTNDDTPIRYSVYNPNTGELSVSLTKVGCSDEAGRQWCGLIDASVEASFAVGEGMDFDSVRSIVNDGKLGPVESLAVVAKPSKKFAPSGYEVRYGEEGVSVRESGRTRREYGPSDDPASLSAANLRAIKLASQVTAELASETTK